MSPFLAVVAIREPLLENMISGALVLTKPPLEKQDFQG
jgi:hypothetical protein